MMKEITKQDLMKLNNKSGQGIDDSQIMTRYKKHETDLEKVHTYKIVYDKPLNVSSATKGIHMVYILVLAALTFVSADLLAVAIKLCSSLDSVVAVDKRMTSCRNQCDPQQAKEKR